MWPEATDRTDMTTGSLDLAPVLWTLPGPAPESRDKTEPRQPSSQELILFLELCLSVECKHQTRQIRSSEGGLKTHSPPFGQWIGGTKG